MSDWWAGYVLPPARTTPLPEGFRNPRERGIGLRTTGPAALNRLTTRDDMSNTRQTVLTKEAA